MNFQSLQSILLKRSAIDNSNKNHHDCNYQKNVDKTTYRIRSNQSKQPQNDKYYSDGK
jgi:hypothetical protein